MFPCCLRRRWRRSRPAPDGAYVDGTFGAGGYARALLDRGAHVIAIDRDPAAIQAGGPLVAASERAASNL